MDAIKSIDPDQSLQKRITELKKVPEKDLKAYKENIDKLYQEFLDKIIYITDIDDPEEVKVLDNLKKYQNSDVYDKLVILSEFINASMHSELT
jgi:UDP-N-acetyl-D-mannosaminuronate dehydrogenase